LPLTLAVGIAALLAVADLIVINPEPPAAEYIRETTDSWNASIAHRNVLAHDIIEVCLLANIWVIYSITSDTSVSACWTVKRGSSTY
jgi:GH15 family glucan-1,4-alpha-glucosidase